MNVIEEQIIALIEKELIIPQDLKNQLDKLPLGKLSREFYEDFRVTTYCTRYADDLLSFRLALEKYIGSDHSQPYLEKIEEELQNLPSPLFTWDQTGLQDKAAGTYLMPIPRQWIVQLYQLEDPVLNQLLQKHLPTPPARLFTNGPVPSLIQQKADECSEVMTKIDSKSSERIILKIQRQIRMKNRYEEELNRIALRDKWYLKEFGMTANDLIRDANTPYKPQCAPALSDRIMAAAKKVTAFSTVKHITSESAIQSIFDNALYGRRTLMNLYLDYNSASLYPQDLLNGDANAVCLGPQNIDPLAKGGIIIEFDLPKLIQSKPSAFYKQRDFQYQLDAIRQIELGNETLFFTHTGSNARRNQPSYTYLNIMDEVGRETHSAHVPKSNLIAYNLEQMHEILTLNFFRFIDKLDPSYIDLFYQKVDKLTEEQLVVFLTSLERNMTDTAEFNFYGAHQIDCSTIINITKRYKGYTLHLPTWIEALNKGQMDQIQEAQTHLPELFQSYRFLDYLLLKVQNLNIRYELDKLRSQCKTPEWVQYAPLNISEGLTFFKSKDKQKQETAGTSKKMEHNCVV